MKKIIVRNYERAKDLLTKNVDKLHALSEALLDYETLDGGQIERVVQGEKLPPFKKVSDATVVNPVPKDSSKDLPIPGAVVTPQISKA